MGSSNRFDAPALSNRTVLIRQLEAMREQLPPAYLREPSPDEAAIDAALWRDFALSSSHADRDALARHWLRLVLCVAIRRSWRRLETRRLDLDDLIAAGTVGLLAGIDDCPAGPDSARSARSYVAVAVASAMTQGDETADARLKVFRQRKRHARQVFVDRFVRLHGRAPDDAERETFNRTLLTNPDFQIGSTPMVLNWGRSEALAREAEAAAAKRDEPARPAFHSKRLMRRAMRDLDAEDRRLLRMVMRGMTIGEIGRRIARSKSATRAKVNRVLWNLRSRADLAEALGVEAITPPKPNHRGFVPSLLKDTAARKAG